MIKFTDQLGNSIELPPAPKRIVSLVPSQTELLFDLGLNDEVAGITKFCVHPEHWFRTKTRIGGTKDVNIDTINELHPDLIIANKEENVKELIEALRKIAPVWVSDVNSLDDALSMIRSVGGMVDKTTEANELAESIQAAFGRMPTAYQSSAAYLIWKDPYMAAGGDTFISDMMKYCGLKNVFEHLKRYPEVTVESLNAAGCQNILLSSEPYPFKQKHAAELQKQLPGKNIMLVDGEMFSWYGSRLQQAAGYLENLVQVIFT